MMCSTCHEDKDPADFFVLVRPPMCTLCMYQASKMSAQAAKPLIPHPAVEQMRSAYRRAIAKHQAAIAKLEAEQQTALEGMCACIGNGHLWWPDDTLSAVCMNCGKAREE